MNKRKREKRYSKKSKKHIDGLEGWMLTDMLINIIVMPFEILFKLVAAIFKD